jgi:hypothetical protein
MNAQPLPTNQDMQLLQRGLAIGNQAVIETVECEAVRVQLPEPGRWYDTRPMLDPREHAPQVIDMAAEALSYGETAGLLRRHTAHRHLVCIVPEAQGGAA